MDISTHMLGNAEVLKLKGNLVLGEPVEKLRDTIDEFIQGGQARLIVDLGGVHMVDSSGLGALVRALATAKKRGGFIKLVNPSPLALQTFKTVGLLNLFEVYPDEAQAAAAAG